MSFWDLERIVSNYSIILEMWRGSVYIVKGEKTQFSHKFNRLNPFIKCLNRLRQQKDRHRSMKDDTIQSTFESIQVYLGWRLIRFKLRMNWFNASQRVLWDESKRKEMMHTWIDSNKCELIHMKSETLLNRFRLWWVDSNWSKMNFDTFSNETITSTPNHIDSRVL